MKIQKLIILLLLNVSTATAQEQSSGIRDYFFVEGSALTGVQSYDSKTYNGAYRSTYMTAGIGVGMGSKWYLKRNERHGAGLMINWLRGEIYTTFDNFEEVNLNLAPMHLGLTNAWSRDGQHTVELNVSGGYAPQILDFRFFHGIQFSPEVKFHGKRTVIGLSYVFTRSTHGQGYYQIINTNNSLRLTIGLSNAKERCGKG